MIPSNKQIYIKIIKQHQQSANKVFLLPNPDDDFLLNDTLANVTNPQL